MYLNGVLEHLNMPDSPATRRRKWREQYSRSFPAGFKRRRNAEQTAKQRAAQRAYDQRRFNSPLRKLQIRVRKFISGESDAAQDLIGCSRRDLLTHLESTLPPHVAKWKLSYVKLPREFDLTKEEDRKQCFHYSNLKAQPTMFNHAAATSQPPSTPAPLQASV